MDAIMNSRSVVARMLLCAGDGSYMPFVPGAALAILGFLVLAIGLLFARSASRRTRLGDPANANPAYVYVIIVLLIIAGCFLITFGVALLGIFITAC